MGVDILSLLIGFLTGLVVFQVRGAKELLNLVGLTGTMLFVWSLVKTVIRGADPNLIVDNVLSFTVGGFLGNLVYLIGVNISRYEQFGVMSSRIFVYILLVFFMFYILLLFG